MDCGIPTREDDGIDVPHQGIPTGWDPYARGRRPTTHTVGGGLAVGSLRARTTEWMPVLRAVRRSVVPTREDDGQQP